MSLTLRRARPDEAGLVLSFVRELAEYENLLHEVEAIDATIGAAWLHLAQHCVANGWSRLQRAVLDGNTPSIEFYNSLGAELIDERTVCRVGGPALAQGMR
jgi:hypothetical protein